MELVVHLGAGIDIHKRTAVVHVRLVLPDQTLFRETRTFSTMTHDLLRLHDWLLQLGVTHVAMESTGEFWKPLYALLEGSFSLVVANAQHIKHVPGRKTDVRDAEWLAELLAHGLLRASFIPALQQRDLRDLTRQRTNLVQDRATVLNRLQKVLEWANLKLAAVVSDVRGVSARAMLEAIIGEQSDPQVLADLAKGRLRSKREALVAALTGRVRGHHRFLLAQHLEQIDFLDEQIQALGEQIQTLIQNQSGSSSDNAAGASQRSGAQVADGVQVADGAQVADSAPAGKGEAGLSWSEAHAIWDSVPGVGPRLAEQLVAELGADMSRFASAGHLASWARVCPGTNESAGKRKSSRTGRGNRWLRTGLVQAAHAAVRVKDSALAHLYRRLAPRRGAKRAIMAVAHRLLTLGYTLLNRREQYREPDLTERAAQQRERLAQQLQRKLARLGYRADVTPMEAAA